MNKVVTIHLNGRSYQLDEAGFEALRAYLDEASSRLADDPSKQEIIADLEQAIAEKCDKLLSPHKNVVSNDEVRKIIEEMGPVEGDAKKEEHSHGKSSGTHNEQAPKHLFLIREGAVFAGVCAGIAAYFNLDVSIVRVAFVALTVFTGGIWILVYLALALFVPYADTAEARAQAHGEAFNAQALVDRAKERWGESYERVTGTKWDDTIGKMGTAHEAHLKWKQMRKQERRQWKQQWKHQARSNARYIYRSNPVFGLLRALLAIAWIFAEISLITTGMIFGWMLPAGVPVWLAMIALFVLYHAVTGPMKTARYAPAWSGDPYGNNYSWAYTEWDGLVDGLTILFLVIAFGWAYFHVPQFGLFVHHPVAETKLAITQFKLWWQQTF